jgi:hypothetical protein
MTGQDNPDWRRQLTIFTSALQDQAHRIWVGDAALQGFLDASLQFGGTITVKQA